MAKFELTDEEIEVLFTLIYRLRDQPVQSKLRAEELRQQLARPIGTGVRPVHEFRLEPGLQGRDTPSGGPVDGRTAGLVDNLAALNQGLDQWFAAGLAPPVAPPMRIELRLIEAKALALERAFLAVFSSHFGTDYADRYRVLIERAIAVEAFPLAAHTTLDIRNQPGVAPRTSTPALFGDFELTERTEEPVPQEAEPASLHVDHALAELPGSLGLRRPKVPQPLALDSGLRRKAGVKLGMLPPPRIGRSGWGIFQSYRR